MATKAKTNTEKTVSKRKVEKKIEELTKVTDFEMVRSNTLSFDDHNEELKEVLYEIWTSIKRSNPKTSNFAPSIMLLFSVVTELYWLHKDRETRLGQKQEMYREWVQKAKAQQDLCEDARKRNNAIIKALKEELKTTTLADKQAIIKRKIAEVERDKIDIHFKLLDAQQDEKNHLRSQKLKMFEVTQSGKIMYDMSTQLSKKNGELILLLKEFGVNPKIAGNGIFEGNVGPNPINKVFNGMAD